MCSDRMEAMMADYLPSMLQPPSLCNGVDPASVIVEQRKTHTHLTKALRDSQPQLSPIQSLKRKSSKKKLKSVIAEPFISVFVGSPMLVPSGLHRIQCTVHRMQGVVPSGWHSAQDAGGWCPQGGTVHRMQGVVPSGWHSTQDAGGGATRPMPRSHHEPGGGVEL